VISRDATAASLACDPAGRCDADEPGTADQIGFLVRDAGGAVVLNLPLQNIVGVNVQAHYDQLHKQ
jgi:hypothetical protein